MCEICEAILTPFAALLLSQLEDSVQSWKLPFWKDTDRRSVIRALSEASQGEGTGQKNSIQTLQGWITGGTYFQGRLWSPGKDKKCLHYVCL